MTTDARLAFEHPEERAKAMAGDTPRDRISLRDHVVAVEIGAFGVERDLTQRLSFNVVVEVAPLNDPALDDVDRILSYDKLTEAIAQELAAERLNLLETLAERVADRILAEPQACRVFVRIEKLDRGPGALGVEIVRDRSGVKPLADSDARDQQVLHPVVAFLAESLPSGDALSALIDELGAPLILCVGRSYAVVPEARSQAAQRRIALLAMEQNAWSLAERDDRCVVVASRTELDWAMKNGMVPVWAPSKIVLDAVDAPSADRFDALALTLWFAGQMQAAELVTIGSAPPTDARIPVRAMTVLR